MRPSRLAVVLLAVLTACGSASAPKHSSTAVAVSETPTPTPAPPTPTPIPPLTAPAMIQVENSPAGRPQSGLAAANLVYEYVAEGGIGRFSVFFFGSPPAQQLVGPVRSARTVTVQLATLYHAFLAYSGASTYIGHLLAAAAFPSYDEDSAQGNLFRISTRYPPHNLYTDGQHIANLAARAARPAAPYQLWSRTAAATGGIPVTGFTATISPYETPHFTWNAAAGGFTRTEDTGQVVDPRTRAPLVLPTVIVQQVAVTTDPRVVDVDGHLGVDQAITGSGTAQVFTNGQEFAATWTQPAAGPPQFTLADGSPAPIAPGEVWISLVQIGQPAAVS